LDQKLNDEILREIGLEHIERLPGRRGMRRSHLRDYLKWLLSFPRGPPLNYSALRLSAFGNCYKFVSLGFKIFYHY
jgi:hypothetical protein